MAVEEFKGRWWLATDADRKRHGILTIRDGGHGRLELSESFEPGLKDLLSPDQTPVLVLGEAASGEDLTMVRAIPLGGGNYICSLTVSGGHFTSESDIRFSKVWLRFENLDAWVQRAGFAIDAMPPEVTITYRRPEPIPLYATDDLQVHVTFSCSGPSLTVPQTDVHIREEKHLRIERAGGISVEGLFSDAYLVGGFLALAIGRDVRPVTIQATSPSITERLPDGRTYEPVLKIRAEMGVDAGKHHPRLPHDMRFSLGDSADRVPTLLGNWLNKEPVLRPVYSLYLGVLSNDRMFVDQRFLSILHALETYHRRTSNRTELPQEEHAARLEAIVRGVPEGHREWLRGKLRWSNELTLRQRLRELFDRHESVMSKYVKDRNAFVAAAVSTRNYQTHHTEELAGQAAGGAALFTLTEQLQVLLESCLLNELGFELPELPRLFEYRRLAQLLD